MAHSEFQAWIRFWETCPFDDAGRYHRPAALIAHATNGRDIPEALRWLSRELVPDQFSDADMNTFIALGVSPPGKG